jgi:hypothetical protein
MRMFAGQMMGAAPTTLDNAPSAHAETVHLTDDAANSSGDECTNTMIQRKPKQRRTFKQLLCCEARERESSKTEQRNSWLYYYYYYYYLVFVRMAKRAEKARRALSTRDPSKSVDKIDTVAKILFPFCYLL